MPRSLFRSVVGILLAGWAAGCGGDSPDPNDPGGGPNLEELQINSSPFENEIGVQFVAAGPNGTFTAVWHIPQHFSDGGRTDRVVAQRIDADGRKAGAELAVSTPAELGLLRSSSLRPLGFGLQGVTAFGFAGLTNCNPDCFNAVFMHRFRAEGTSEGSSLLIDAVNSFQGNVDAPSVGISSSGAALAVWSSQPDRRFNSWVVKGQRFAADGSRLGNPFAISTSRQILSSAHVAVAPDGAALVTWITPADGFSDVRGRRLDASGAGTGREIVLCKKCGELQAAIGPNGEVVSVYGPVGEGRVLMQRLSASGSPVGGAVQVNTTSSAGQPRISMAPDGKFAVAWIAGQTVQVQRFTADGASLGAAFQASTTGPLAAFSPDVALAASGRMLVTWVNLRSPSVPDSIRGRLFAE